VQILYVEKLHSLGYEQHTYEIIGKKCTCQKMSSTHIHKQQSLDISKIHMSTLNLHCTICDSHIPMMKKLPINTI
jgi:hypothetical protein